MSLSPLLQPSQFYDAVILSCACNPFLTKSGSDKTNVCRFVTALLPLPACKLLFVCLVMTHGKAVPCLWLKVLCC